MSQAEERAFVVDPHIAFSLVTAQAGSVEKALLEAIGNSIDAGATRIDIVLNARTVTITDDGRGLSKEEEIRRWFEVLGFDHALAGNTRGCGSFGVGRAQLFSFCHTVWRTHSFEMDVDIKNRGMGYRYRKDLPHQNGVEIVGHFYEPRTEYEMAVITRELKRMAKYCQIQVSLDGMVISKSAAHEEWTHETDDAWIKIVDKSELDVYNLGMLVRSYSRSTVGAGGVVVTKPGHKLALNMARSDVLLTTCEVWRRIAALLRKHGVERSAKKDVRKTKEDRDFLAREIMARKTATYAELFTHRLITDIRGRTMSLYSLFEKAQIAQCVIVADRDDKRAHRLAEANTVVALDRETLRRFDADCPSDLGRVLVDLLKASVPDPTWCTRVKWQDDAGEYLDRICESHELITEQKLTALQRAQIQAIRAIGVIVADAIKKMGYPFKEQRTICLGRSEVAEAWTDGTIYIAVEERIAAKLGTGFDAFVRMALLMAHEYLHVESDTASHSHDLEFLEAYHELTFNDTFSKAAMQGYLAYLASLKARKLTINKTLLSNLSCIERAHQVDLSATT